ncbi:type I methionyl aminopeptidase [bacterium]|nr:type I methionyl aminopeptidase [bacterium]
MRKAGVFNAQLMDYIREYVKPGVTTEYINTLVDTYTRDHGHIPAPLHYGGFPKSCCISVNDVVCHGIPNDYVLQDGDIVNIDITSIVDGWHGDQSETFLIGQVSNKARDVAQCALDSLWSAIDALEPNCPIATIGKAIECEASQYNFSIVRELTGHGLGKNFHQEPTVTHYVTPQSEKAHISPGTCFTIEPMINTGSPDVIFDKNDGWTVRTKDGGLSAQFEHTILMTTNGPEVLTVTKQGPQRGHVF